MILKDFKNEPMAFPVFGRGRVLYALIGKGINAGTIEQACRDLTGPCTCQVKDQNPGTDLLMAVNWEKLVTPTAQEEKELPPLTGLIGFPDGSNKKTETAEISDSDKNSLNGKGSDSESSNTLVVTQSEKTLTSATAKGAVNSASALPANIVDGQSPDPSDSAQTAKSSSLMQNLMIMASLMVLVVLGASYMMVVRK